MNQQNGISISGGSSGSVAGGMTLISSQILGSTATSVNFAAIPATYKNLRLVIEFAEGGGGSNLVMQFNGDTGAHYASAYIFNSAGTVSGGVASSAVSSIVGIGTAGSAVIDIPNYLNATLGVQYFTSTSSGTGANFNATIGGNWSPSAAVTSIKIVDSAGASFSIGSAFYLYGY